MMTKKWKKKYTKCNNMQTKKRKMQKTMKMTFLAIAWNLLSAFEWNFQMHNTHLEREIFENVSKKRIFQSRTEHTERECDRVCERKKAENNKLNKWW